MIKDILKEIMGIATNPNEIRKTKDLFDAYRELGSELKLSSKNDDLSHERKEIPKKHDKNVKIKGIKYKIKNEKAIVIGLTKNNGGNIVIPPEIITLDNQKYNITRIKGEAFSYSDSLISIIIPEGIEIIEESTFESCQNLSLVLFPNSLRIINSEAFSFCNKLEAVWIPDNVEYIAPDAFEFSKNAFLFSSSEYLECFAKDNNFYPLKIYLFENLSIILVAFNEETYSKIYENSVHFVNNLDNYMFDDKEDYETDD